MHLTLFLLFLTELDNFESFETNLFSFQKNSQERAKKIFLKIFLKKLQVSNAKTKGNFFQKKSWSQMIQNCLIRREMAKKKIRRQPAFFGGSCGTAAVFSVFRVATFNSKNLKKKKDH